MTRNEPRRRDRFTFSLTGIPVVSSYASVPAIPDDRIRKLPKGSPTKPLETARREEGRSIDEPSALPETA